MPFFNFSCEKHLCDLTVSWFSTFVLILGRSGVLAGAKLADMPIVRRPRSAGNLNFLLHLYIVRKIQLKNT